MIPVSVVVGAVVGVGGVIVQPVGYIEISAAEFDLLALLIDGVGMADAIAAPLMDTAAEHVAAAIENGRARAAGAGRDV